MSVWVLSFLAILLLVLPSVILPMSPRQPGQRQKPEIHGSLRPMHWVMITYCALWHRLKTNGWAPLPETGPALLIANHTCGIDHVCSRRAAAASWASSSPANTMTGT